MTMEDQENYAGIGSVCYLIAKEDLQADGMTPKEGKEWMKLDAVPQTKIAADASATDAQPQSRGFKQSFEMSFEVERVQNLRIHSMMEYSAENLRDCERLLRTWRPRLIARKKLLRASLRLSRDILSEIEAMEQSFDRTLGIMCVNDHITRLRLLLGKKVWCAEAIDPESKHTYAIYARLHRRKIGMVEAKVKQ